MLFPVVDCRVTLVWTRPVVAAKKTALAARIETKKAIDPEWQRFAGHSATRSITSQRQQRTRRQPPHSACQKYNELELTSTISGLSIKHGPVFGHDHSLVQQPPSPHQIGQALLL